MPLFVAQALVTLGTAFLQMGFFFYATDRWGWLPRQNLTLAAVQGLAYVLGALSSSKLAGRVGRKTLTVLLPILFGVVAVACAFNSARPMVVAPVLVVLYFLVAAYWPGIESLVATGTDAHSMARRLSAYNLFWPAIGAAGTAVCGFVIAHLPVGFFYISAVINALAGVTMWVGGWQPEEGKRNGETANGRNGEVSASHASSEAEPELLHQRTLALWLSRIALPSTYLVMYALAALMPTLPSLSKQSISVQTVIGSIWLVGRWVAFTVLALSAFWHTRPRLLILAAVIMLVSFAAICVPVTAIIGGTAGSNIDLWTMGIAQFVLGWAVALIYSASLYFGMVLSEGSTEHGGYHEALIGLGQSLGPGVAAGAQALKPGSIVPAVAAISAMLAISLGASCYAAVHFRRKREVMRDE